MEGSLCERERITRLVLRSDSLRISKDYMDRFSPAQALSTHPTTSVSWEPRNFLSTWVKGQLQFAESHEIAFPPQHLLWSMKSWSIPWRRFSRSFPEVFNKFSRNATSCSLLSSLSCRISRRVSAATNLKALSPGSEGPDSWWRAPTGKTCSLNTTTEDHHSATRFFRNSKPKGPKPAWHPLRRESRLTRRWGPLRKCLLWQISTSVSLPSPHSGASPGSLPPGSSTCDLGGPARRLFPSVNASGWPPSTRPPKPDNRHLQTFWQALTAAPERIALGSSSTQSISWQPLQTAANLRTRKPTSQPRRKWACVQLAPPTEARQGPGCGRPGPTSLALAQCLFTLSSLAPQPFPPVPVSR